MYLNHCYRFVTVSKSWISKVEIRMVWMLAVLPPGGGQPRLLGTKYTIESYMIDEKYIVSP